MWCTYLAFEQLASACPSPGTSRADRCARTFPAGPIRKASLYESSPSAVPRQCFSNIKLGVKSYPSLLHGCELTDFYMQ